MIKAIQKFLDNRKRTVSIRFKCTAAQAQEAKTRLQALADLMVAAERLNELWRPDFYNYEQPKYFHSYDRMKGEIIIDTTWRYDHGKVYFKSKEVSLLAKYGYTERMAYELCQRYDLLSPLYQLGTRGGCWFCPNIRPKTAAEFKVRHPDLWQRLVDMGKADNMVCKLFNYRDTIEEFDAKLDKINELKDIQQQFNFQD